MEAERRITLAQIDRHWADYLAELAEAREGIMLRVLGDQNPVFELQKIAVERFDFHLQAIEDDAVETLAKAEISGSELRLDGLPSPGTTWTYLTNEETFGTPIERFMTGLVKMSRRKWGRG